LSQAPPTNTIGSPFIELQSVDSTNNYARQQIHAGLAQHGMVIFAHEQVAGKGQRGRVWVSGAGENIAMSILVNPAPLILSQQFQLSACVAVSLHEFFNRYTGGETKIKWPNDLYWQDRKAGGVLIESVVGSSESGVPNWEWAVAGIGININQTSFSAYLPNAVSMKQITGSDFKVIDLVKEFCGVFQRRFDELITTGVEHIFSTYNRHLYKLNEKVRLKKDSRVFEAVIKSVSPAGKLIAQHATEEEFDFGAVAWVI